MKIVPGINIQYPYSQLILSGKKSIETRTYPIPEHLLNVDLASIETPGQEGTFPARVIGLIRFSRSIRYESKASFNKDFDKHQVTESSRHSWDGNDKWGWVVEKVIKFPKPKAAPARKGIVFTKEVEI